MEIDYGDVLVFRGSLYTAKAATLILNAYNLNVDIDRLVSLGNAHQLDINKHVIYKYPKLLILRKDPQFAEAKDAMRQAIDSFTSAINFIVAETDPQYDDLFIIDDPRKEERYRNLLEDLKHALDGATLIREIGYRVDLTKFFDSPRALRDFLPEFFADGFIERNSFPDPTFGGILPDMTQDELNRILARYVR